MIKHTQQYYTMSLFIEKDRFFNEALKNNTLHAFLMYMSVNMFVLNTLELAEKVLGS